MKKKTITKIAIIGCGRIVGHHLNSIKKIPELKVISICDIDFEKALAYANEFNLRPYANYRKMLTEENDINLVIIATPSGMHYEHSIEILKIYKKNIVVEKPTFMRHDQLEDAYSIAKKNNLKIFPVFQNRYNSAVRRVKKSIIKKEIGEIRLINVRVRWCRPQRYYDMSPWRGTYSHDGGALTNQGVHHVDLLRYLGGEIEKVNSLKSTLGVSAEVEDSFISIFKYKSGALGSLEITTSARPKDFEASISIVGSEGLLQLGGVAVNKLEIFSPDPQQCHIHSDDFSDLNERGRVYGRGHLNFYKDVVNDLNNQISFPINKEDCRKTIALLHSFYLSAEEQKWVKVNENKFSKYLGKENSTISDLYRI